MKNEEGRFTAMSEKCDFCLCDNRWHHAEAEFLENVARLRVDYGKLQVAVSVGLKRELNAMNSLYIGGLPGT